MEFIKIKMKKKAIIISIKGFELTNNHTNDKPRGFWNLLKSK